MPNLLLSLLRYAMRAAVANLEDSLYCLGCCWLLFVILFPLGMMNIAVLGLLTALIFAEKCLPIGPLAARTAAGVLVVYGLVVIVVPAALPTIMS